MGESNMGKINLKSNKGVTITDVIVAVIILSLFVGIIGNMFYQIARNSSFIRYNTIAVYYAIKIAEDIDIMSYEEVTNELNNNLTQKYQMPEGFNGILEVSKYNEEDLTKEDIIKKVKITINYTFLNEQRSYKIEKLKIKEM